MKTILITGITSGIGQALFLHYLNKGHFVIGVARNKRKIETLKDSIDRDNFKIYQADLSSLTSIETLGETIQEDFKEGLDVLINNAAIVQSGKTFTADGFELQYQVNHLSVAYLSLVLYPLLTLRDGRVIITGSDAHKKAKFDEKDIEAIIHYHALRSYARTKLYNLLFAHWFNDERDNVTCYVVSPGRVKTGIGTKETSKFHAIFWKLFTIIGQKPKDVVRTYDYLMATPKERLNATYYHNEAPEEESPAAKSQSNVNALMKKTLSDLKR
ncbi:MAG: SDR family NAD(P)-dependent oxidoreductase [Bacillota bacterium]